MPVIGRPSRGAMAVGALAFSLAVATGVAVGMANASNGTQFRVNDAGQTIGGFRVGEDAPDLLSVDLKESRVELNEAGTGLSVGYIYSEDFIGKEASSPEEAKELMAERVDDSGAVWIPVYDRDGTTEIGRLQLAQVTQDVDVKD